VKNKAIIINPTKRAEKAVITQRMHTPGSTIVRIGRVFYLRTLIVKYQN